MRVAIFVLWAVAAAHAQEKPKEAFFSKDVDFFGTKKKAPPETAPMWDGDKPPAAPVRALLENPTPENAKRYLDWQRERLTKLQKAIEALEAARTPEGPKEILLFTREDCPFCKEQDKLLGDLKVRRIRPGESPELWLKYGANATPTIVVGTKVFRGVTPREVIEKEIQP